MEFKKKDHLVPFECSLCGISMSGKFGELNFTKSRYVEDVYYIHDPFEAPDIHKKAEDYTIDDFVVFGANCFICKQQTCIDEECSIFYKHYYCMRCAKRDHDSFPREIIASFQKKIQTTSK